MTVGGIIKIAVAFAAGTGIGVLGTARHFKLKYEKIAQDDIATIRNYYNKSEGMTSRATKKPVEQPVADIGARREGERTDYTAFQRSPKELEDREDVINRVEDRRLEEEYPSEDDGTARKSKPKNGPKPVKRELFGTDPNLEVVTLHYYPEEDILTDDEDVPFDPDRVRMVVGDWIERFGFGDPDNDTDVLYIRNEFHGCDYKVEKIHTNFSG